MNESVHARVHGGAMLRNHSLNENEKMLRRFYEPIVLLSVLDPTRGAHLPDLITDTGLDEKAKLWRKYVDQLSWICDSEKGGDTVTAIAAQQTTEAPIFWLASNSSSRGKARDHLIEILDRLNCLYAANPLSTTQLQVEITARCIRFSSDRIKTYLTWLLQAINKVKCSREGLPTHEDKVLFKELEKFDSFKTDFHLLCAFAYSFRSSESMKILCRRHNAQSSRGVWSDIRHFIGRLGSWTKATQILILGAEIFPQRIENAQVKVIGPNGPANLPSKTHLTDLRGLVHRMLPSNKAALVEELIQILIDADSVAQIEHRFREYYAKIRPRPHAELLVLEHFHDNGFDFVADDKYIGCSKPSCYCCHAYIQCHPGGFTPRPCHGNLWINWAPPIPLPALTPRNRRGGPRVRPQEHHTFQMLQKMMVPIRQDLQRQILSRRPKRARLPDSTTGISSIVLETQAPRVALEQIVEEHQSYNSAYTDITDSGTGIAEDDASLLFWRNIDRDTEASLVSMKYITSTQELNNEHEDNAEESHDGAAELTKAEVTDNGGLPQGFMKCSNDDDDDDTSDDGGVLLFTGRKSYRC